MSGSLVGVSLAISRGRADDDGSSTIPKEEAKADSKKSCTGMVAGDSHQKVAESSTASEPKASGEWGDIYDDISDDDEEEDDDEEDEVDGFDDAARPGQTATQYGWL
ncbi:hypothetical protein CKM354_000936900 [Cercospora kikuchii]|uniref:Uncharacterized protein n=1 Tax=Cercospora kikuchii TaxID=84275 RepID=A0A9P3CPF3_9PEZI|nr:uncharacterized protein CKM354_000936900 [Cercospora kikuchii]GIZ46236.1 hypothetical protein CKM354_000936900 [Cercospora kikuchii]